MSESEIAQTSSPDQREGDQRHSRRWFRRLLGILLVAVAIPLLIVGDRYQQQVAFIEGVESRYGRVVTEPWGPEWLRDMVGEKRLRGFARMSRISIRQADDADLRVIYRRQLPDILELYDPWFSAEVAAEFHRLNGIDELEFWSLKDQKTEILAQLKSFRSLKRLSLRKSDLTENDLQFLSGLTALEELDLQMSAFRSSELSHLRKLTNLHDLDLAETGLTDEDAAAIGQLTQIDQYLDLTGNPISDRGLEHLESLTKLRGLTLVGTNMTDRGLRSLAKLTNLENVDLYDNDITDAGVPQLYHLSKLKRLNLTGTAVTPEGYQQARAALPFCDVSHSVLLQKKPPPK